ncbi:heme ABC exporter ATP-binding protein CcmA [Roseospirillum parvum]|uniref:Heme exporter protein A n=1 Tax=Roseospirillum parvum TaxID=83401 RepID=A0A1G8C401_9PROT|nr:heme ABC exporter ATP-binding protein CcmA [Roseospirillum parvum]SDH39700.1 heme exporter protein A [Roseospirillum parvum]
MSDPAPVLEARDLMCVRGERVVFAGLDLTLKAGQAVLLLGPNGSGKSSFLRLLAGLLRPAAGRLTVDGEEVFADRETHGRKARYVGHLDAVKPVLSAAENLAFWGQLYGLSGAALETAVADALAALDIARLAATPGKMLSAGQKRRLNLARLLLAPAPLWLLDEPTTALDKATIARFEALLARHRADGGMVVLSTHAPVDLPGAGELYMDRFAVDPGTTTFDLHHL